MPPHLRIGCLIYPAIDQIDFTGPFEVFSRLPDTSVYVIGKERAPLHDMAGLVLTPECTIAEAPTLDLLHVPGGPGQQDVMDDESILSFIRKHMEADGYLFSVCTGALVCGAAGVLSGRRATTHWSAFELLSYFGAIPVDERVVIDGKLITTAGVTAGIDGALTVASILCGQTVAEQIQLAIQYDPQPPFHAGSPATAPKAVLEFVREKYRGLTAARTATAQRITVKLAAAE